MVYLYLREFNEIPDKWKIADCELGFDPENKRYYLSTIITANVIGEAEKQGEQRLNKIFGIIELFLGITYPISGIQVYQISGNKPFERMAPMTLQRRRYLPIDRGKLEDITNFVISYDKLALKNESIKRVDKIISYYLRGCNLEEYWLSESFLNFFKVIELISYEFAKNFKTEINKQLKNTLLQDLTPQEMGRLHSERRLIEYMHKKLGIAIKFDIKKIVRLRHEFIAHARIEDTTISREEFNICKHLAGQAIMKYVEQFSKKKL